MRKEYNKEMIKNDIRQMYSQEKVGIFLEKYINYYKCAIVCNPDIYLINKINVKHINYCVHNNSIVHTRNFNDSQCYTNGFYIGSLIPLYLLTIKMPKYLYIFINFS
jgi:hypothetical protein